MIEIGGRELATPGELVLLIAVIAFFVWGFRRQRRLSASGSGGERSLRSRPHVRPDPIPTGTGTSQVVLVQSGARTPQVIAVVRDATGRGLTEATQLVDAGDGSPQVVIDRISAESAARVAGALTDAGATAEVRASVSP